MTPLLKSCTPLLEGKLQIGASRQILYLATPLLFREHQATVPGLIARQDTVGHCMFVGLLKSCR
jgi:hypothetical protein